VRENTVSGLRSCGLDRSRDEVVTTIEVSVEATVGQPCGFHQRGDADARQTVLAEGLRSRSDDAAANSLFVTFCVSHDDHHSIDKAEAPLVTPAPVFGPVRSATLTPVAANVPQQSALRSTTAQSVSPEALSLARQCASPPHGSDSSTYGSILGAQFWRSTSSGWYIDAVARFSVAFGLVAYLATASVDGSTCDEGGCTQHCAHDDQDGTCPSDCIDCGGCAHLNLLVVVVGVRELQVPSCHAAERMQAIPPSPAPAEILHVPIVLLA
jgi:hypothetical protein